MADYLFRVGICLFAVNNNMMTLDLFNVIYSDIYSDILIYKSKSKVNSGKESKKLEFKKSTGELKEGMVSISSILNKHGVGTLYFGVKPSGDIVGQMSSESSLRDVSRAIYETIRPQIYPVIKEEVLDDLHVIKVEFNGNDRPYSASDRYYLRTADEDREVTPAE